MKIIYIVLIFFSIFGLFQMIKYIVMWLVTRKDNKFSIIVTVKNQADEVENIIRSIAWNAMNGLKCAGVPHILVVDMGSDDDTFEVLEALSRDYSFIECTNDKNCAELIMGLHFREQ